MNLIKTGTQYCKQSEYPRPFGSKSLLRIAEQCGILQETISPNGEKLWMVTLEYVTLYRRNK